MSGSNKKKNFDSVDVLAYLKKEKNLKVKLGIAYNPYLKKYYNIPSELSLIHISEPTRRM